MADSPPRPRAPRPPPKPKPKPKPKATDATGATGATDTGGNGGTGSPPPPPPPPARARAPRTGTLEAKLQQFCAMPSLAFAAAGDQYCAEMWAARSDMLASSWFELSKQNAGVRKVLEQLVEGSAWGGVVMSTLAISLPIAKHHGLYRGPDPFAGFLPGPPAPPPRGKRESNGGPRQMQWSTPPGAAAPSAAPVAPSGDDDTAVPAPIYLEGAPPGVVTVAASAAAHNGAR